MKLEPDMKLLLGLLIRKEVLTRDEANDFAADLKKIGESKFSSTYSDAFTKFWKRWKHRGNKPHRKAAAYKAWQSLKLNSNPDHLSLVYRAFEICLKSDQWAKGYIPDMDRWLKDRPWEDGEGMTKPKTDSLAIGGTNEW